MVSDNSVRGLLEVSEHPIPSELLIPMVKNKKLKIKSGRLLVRTILGERVVQKHRIETLNKNRDAP